MLALPLRETGSAGWLYRLGVEQLLGLRRAGEALTVDPCIPGDWPGFTAQYRYGGATYNITVERGQPGATLDGEPVDAAAIPLSDDGREHEVVVRLGR